MNLANQTIEEIITWAGALADSYDTSVAHIIYALARANEELRNISKAKAFMENEMKSLRGNTND